jgi:hypothetical protein
MNHFKQFDSSAWVLFKQTTFSYRTFGEKQNQLSIEDMFITRFLLTQWKECLLKNSLYNANEVFWSQISAIIKKKFVRYP